MQQHPNITRFSSYFVPTLREDPQEAQIVSHRFMLRAGMIKQAASGIYSWLPLGLRVLRKIEKIVVEEQSRINAHQLLMPTIQPADLWRESGRYDDYGKEMLRIQDRHERDLLYGPTNEELVTAIMRDSVNSYRDLPQMLYHIQWKFRDEIRPRFGVMRGREFFMKDGYSFDYDEKMGLHAYDKVFVSYLRTFKRLGLSAIPMKADTGPIGGDSSHEFIILAETGESEVFCDKKLLSLNPDEADINLDSDLQPFIQQWTSRYAATEEMHDESQFHALNEEDRISARGIEVGHIFFFGDKYSAPMQATVKNPAGDEVPLLSGSYGIGVSRLMGAMIEASHDEKGIIWHKNVTPFDAVIINLNHQDEATCNLSDDVALTLANEGWDILLDDRDKRAGEKFSDHDLIGIPVHIIISKKSLETGEIEVKLRHNNQRDFIPKDNLLTTLNQLHQQL